jgi:hypothetical protein
LSAESESNQKASLAKTFRGWGNDDILNLSAELPTGERRKRCFCPIDGASNGPQSLILVSCFRIVAASLTFLLIIAVAALAHARVNLSLPCFSRGALIQAGDF